MEQNSKMHVGLTIGVDLGDRRSDLCVLDGQGEVQARTKAATTEAGLAKAMRRYPGARVVMEVGVHSPWVSRLLERLGCEVIVANARRVRAIAKNEDKNDAIDAELLARLGRVDPQLLKPIEHRGEQAQRDRTVLRARDVLVRARTNLVVQARGLAKALGQRLPSCTPDYFAGRMEKEGLDESFPGMKPLVEMIAELNKRVREMDKEIERLCAEVYPETNRLRQIQGVGPITSLAFVLTIEHPSRFKQSRQVGAYVGLRPKLWQSGRYEGQLRITKAGDRFLRRMLVQASQCILGRRGVDTALRRFGERLMKRGGTKARKKAVVAVARKLAVVLHRIWASGQTYEPLHGVAKA